MRNVESSLGVTARRSGSVTTFFLRDPNGTILSSRTGSTRVNYVSEASGHVVWLVAPDGTQVGGYKYAPYGKTAAYGSAAQTNRFRWLGAQQNITSSGTDGHYKLGARYYDLQGHFTQPDPLSGGLGDPRTLTGYNYGNADPINLFDPSGLFDVPDPLGAASRFVGRVAGYATVYETGFCLVRQEITGPKLSYSDINGVGDVAQAFGIGALGIGSCVPVLGTYLPSPESLL